jgi:hypothetical protein
MLQPHPSDQDLVAVATADLEAIRAPAAVLVATFNPSAWRSSSRPYETPLVIGQCRFVRQGLALKDGVHPPSHRLKQLDNELLALGEETMLIEELDGFVAGLVVCPDLIKPSEWLPIVWGQDSDDCMAAPAGQQRLTRPC